PVPPGLNVGKWVTKQAPLGKGKDGKERRGHKSVWAVDKVEVTQAVEIVPSKGGALDTCLVSYEVVNKDDKPHRVAVRVLLDTFIGDNDGHPFAVLGKDELITTSADFHAGKNMPAAVRALQRPDLKNPGVVALFTLTPGDVVAGADRFSITRLPASQNEVLGWEIPVRDIAGDAAVVFYWNARELKGGERRQVGFAYGGGEVSLGASKGTPAPPRPAK